MSENDDSKGKDPKRTMVFWGTEDDPRPKTEELPVLDDLDDEDYLGADSELKRTMLGTPSQQPPESGFPSVDAPVEEQVQQIYGMGEGKPGVPPQSSDKGSTDLGIGAIPDERPPKTVEPEAKLTPRSTLDGFVQDPQSPKPRTTLRGPEFSDAAIQVVQQGPPEVPTAPMEMPSAQQEIPPAYADIESIPDTHNFTFPDSESRRTAAPSAKQREYAAAEAEDLYGELDGESSVMEPMPAPPEDHADGLDELLDFDPRAAAPPLGLASKDMQVTGAPKYHEPSADDIRFLVKKVDGSVRPPKDYDVFREERVVVDESDEDLNRGDLLFDDEDEEETVIESGTRSIPETATEIPDGPAPGEDYSASEPTVMRSYSPELVAQSRPDVGEVASRLIGEKISDDSLPDLSEFERPISSDDLEAAVKEVQRGSPDVTRQDPPPVPVPQADLDEKLQLDRYEGAAIDDEGDAQSVIDAEKLAEQYKEPVSPVRRTVGMQAVEVKEDTGNLVIKQKGVPTTAVDVTRPTEAYESLTDEEVAALSNPEIPIDDNKDGPDLKEEPSMTPLPPPTPAVKPRIVPLNELKAAAETDKSAGSTAGDYDSLASFVMTPSDARVAAEPRPATENGSPDAGVENDYEKHGLPDYSEREDSGADVVKALLSGGDVAKTEYSQEELDRLTAQRKAEKAARLAVPDEDPFVREYEPESAYEETLDKTEMDEDERSAVKRSLGSSISGGFQYFGKGMKKTFDSWMSKTLIALVAVDVFGNAAAIYYKNQAEKKKDTPQKPIPAGTPTPDAGVDAAAPVDAAQVASRSLDAAVRAADARVSVAARKQEDAAVMAATKQYLDAKVVSIKPRVRADAGVKKLTIVASNPATTPATTPATKPVKRPVTKPGLASPGIVERYSQQKYAELLDAWKAGKTRSRYKSLRSDVAPTWQDVWNFYYQKGSYSHRKAYKLAAADGLDLDSLANKRKRSKRFNPDKYWAKTREEAKIKEKKIHKKWRRLWNRKMGRASLSGLSTYQLAELVIDTMEPPETSENITANYQARLERQPEGGRVEYVEECGAKSSKNDAKDPRERRENNPISGAVVREKAIPRREDYAETIDFSGNDDVPGDGDSPSSPAPLLGLLVPFVVRRRQTSQISQITQTDELGMRDYSALENGNPISAIAEVEVYEELEQLLDERERSDPATVEDIVYEIRDEDIIKMSDAEYFDHVEEKITRLSEYELGEGAQDFDARGDVLEEKIAWMKEREESPYEEMIVETEDSMVIYDHDLDTTITVTEPITREEANLRRIEKKIRKVAEYELGQGSKEFDAVADRVEELVAGKKVYTKTNEPNVPWPASLIENAKITPSNYVYLDQGERCVLQEILLSQELPTSDKKLDARLLAVGSDLYVQTGKRLPLDQLKDVAKRYHNAA